MAFSEDLSAFFGEGDFAVSAQLKNGLTLSGIFDNAFFDNGLGVTQQSTSFLVKTGDLTGVKKNDEIIVDSVRYFISDIEPDGSGVTVLRLERI